MDQVTGTMYNGMYVGKTALITGHTGFKGAWLALYLLRLGAHVVGYSLPAPTSPSLFQKTDLAAALTHIEGDIRHTAALTEVVRSHKPDFIFHMAAQPLVLESYQNPVETFDVNVMGSISVMEAVRAARQPCALIMVVTDKCYENREWHYGYRETDALGGYDPYSASKAAMDIAVSSYRSSFFNPTDAHEHGVMVAQVRSGNVIGGGDWADARIVPDAARAFAKGETLLVRNRRSVRPWQHVLEPLSGYLWLAAKLRGSDGMRCAAAYNFGPQITESHSVGELADAMVQAWGDGVIWQDLTDPRAPHEAGLLKLSIDKAHAELGWSPVWDFETTVRRTMQWYKAALSAEPAVVRDLCDGDIEAYERDAAAKRVLWTQSAGVEHA
ncbi:MAG: CDP-glucose 4,6-dehydratase [bacterium]|nr:CDP-glucose 4,6-dehydratase [bacterium]